MRNAETGEIRCQHSNCICIVHCDDFRPIPLSGFRNPVSVIFRSTAGPALCSNPENLPHMLKKFKNLVPKTELAPENGCVIDTKWKVGPLSYHACASEIGDNSHTVHNAPMPELVVFDHIGFKGAAAAPTSVSTISAIFGTIGSAR